MEPILEGFKFLLPQTVKIIILFSFFFFEESFMFQHHTLQKLAYAINAINRDFFQLQKRSVDHFYSKMPMIFGKTKSRPSVFL